MDILIVDDERTSIAVHGAYVRKLAGYNTVCFGNPCDALAWAATHHPQLVIIDYLMPVMNGVEFTREFRKLPEKETIPVLMVTGFDDPAVRELARGAGINEVLPKPVDRTKLRACIVNMFSGCLTLQDAAGSVVERKDNHDIDGDSLATILAERDRLRAL